MTENWFTKEREWDRDNIRVYIIALVLGLIFIGATVLACAAEARIERRAQITQSIEAGKTYLKSLSLERRRDLYKNAPSDGRKYLESIWSDIGETTLNKEVVGTQKEETSNTVKINGNNDDKYVSYGIVIVGVTCIILICVGIERTISQQKGEVMLDEGIDLDLRTIEAKQTSQTDAITRFSKRPAAAKHLELIGERKERSQSLMVSLAEQMFVLSLYLEEKTVIVQNCKFGVKLTVGDDLGVQIFTLGTNAETIDWKDLISDLVQSRSISSMTSAGRERKQRKRKNDNRIIGGYNVNGNNGELLRNNVPQKYVSLIPTAKMLVEDELAQQKEAIKSELEYLRELDEMTPEWKVYAV